MVKNGYGHLLDLGRDFRLQARPLVPPVDALRARATGCVSSFPRLRVPKLQVDQSSVINRLLASLKEPNQPLWFLHWVPSSSRDLPFLLSQRHPTTIMGFFSFLGRLLFASLFILSAWQMFNDFGDDGGPAAVKHVVLASMALKGLGGILFVFGSTTGAYLLMYYLLFMTPLLHDFYDYEFDDPIFHALLPDFIQSVALLGALLFFVGMKNVLPRKVIKKKPPKTKTI
ncbi:HR-like lesion-inducer [Cynara cardunculus var. scolymus]|uniref:HR-like lesion-inducer n=1 Tax=Cynara cardunculus var. scolymus TaxID=59895 RepID=A0A103XIE1_CYNCS|nr:HR-like lesion-inducer [Cynara cardunculus var. scolymus]